MHVTPDHNGHGQLSEYKGLDFQPETLLGEVCQKKGKLCKVSKVI